MLENGFRIDDIPTKERFDRWRERVCDGSDFEMTSDHAQDFYADDHETELGPLRVAKKTFAPMHMWRNPTPTRDFAHDEAYQLQIPLWGTLHATWNDRQVASGRGDLFVHDISRLQQCDFLTADGRTPFQHATIVIPKTLLSLPTSQTDRILGSRIPGDDGVGALLAGFVTTLANNGASSYRPADGPRVGMVLLGLVDAVFAHALETDPAFPATGAHRHTLALRIQAFIQQHLREPGLTPGALAAAHHISPSYLHRLFQEQGTTVSTWIRAQRLQRARRDLADPVMRDIPIHSIAAGWGFSHPADFSRAFRKAFGTSPKDFRHDTLRSGPH
ncbi:helix-turn-helix domain-containing protein [Nonomuraea sp. NPDC052129]|uniref:helix-turn-helix domain-containing protein n=1 Tax=Nonomuraea sp. NPDC052129 TaxID=3154651 RepID=UPI0034400653